jgi:predicted ATPase with chaperone activity
MIVHMISVSGTTMLAKRVATILPQLTAEESIETSRIYSAMDKLPPGRPMMFRGPFREPHHDQQRRPRGQIPSARENVCRA